MSYEILEKQISRVSEKYQQELLDFVDYLLFKQNSEEKSKDEKTPAQKFLELSWSDERSAEAIISDIEKSRAESPRFGATNEIFA